MNIFEIAKSALNNRYDAPSFLTERGKSSLGKFDETVSDVKKRGTTGMGGPVSGRSPVDLGQTKNSGFNNWQEYEADAKKKKVVKAYEPEAVLGAKDVGFNTGLSKEEKKRWLNNIVRLASGVQPSSKYRATPEAAAENAKYVKEYAKAMLEEAPNYGMDPLIITAISMAESGWGGTRFGNNLGGYGVMGEMNKKPTTDLGYRFEGSDIRDSVKKALKQYSKGYSGLNTPEQFAGPGRWNANGQGGGDPNWLNNLKAVMSMIKQ